MGVVMERQPETRSSQLQIRVTPEEKEMYKRLADDYNRDLSEFIRLVMEFIDEKRPELRIAPKGVALAQ